MHIFQVQGGIRVYAIILDKEAAAAAKKSRRSFFLKSYLIKLHQELKDETE